MNTHSRRPQSLGHVDHVVRKEQLLARHPDVVIVLDEEASPYERWRGVVPGRDAVTSWDLGHLLDRLEEGIAAGEAEERWPGWVFRRRGSEWQARETEGPRVVVGTTLGAVEGRIEVESRRLGT